MKNCIIIKTLSDDLKVIKNIQSALLEQHLVAGCQISEVESSYWWNDKIENTKEYCLQMRTLEDNYNKIETIIKENHNYELPEISYYEIKGSKEILDWIDEYANNK